MPPQKRDISLRYILNAREHVGEILERRFGALGFVSRIIKNLAESLIETVEEISGKSLLFEALSDAERSGLSARIQNLGAELIRDGFLKSLFFHSSYPDDPEVCIAISAWGEFLDKNIEQESKKAGFRLQGFSGADLAREDVAIIKCLGEAVERTCLISCDHKKIIFRPFKDMRGEAINPEEFARFSAIQLARPEFKDFLINESSVFGWVEGKSLLSNKNIFVPAQLVYLSYELGEGEPRIRMPISTGAAAHTDKSEAIYGAICEIIERDAFMIYYLNRLSPSIIDIENSDDGELKAVANKFCEKNLELYILDISTDIPVPVFMALVIDRTGVGNAVTIATKACLDKKDAIKSVAADALKLRYAIRKKMDEKKPKDLQDSHNHRLGMERGLMWSDAKMIPEIEFLTEGAKKKYSKSDIPQDSRARLDLALDYFKKNNMEVALVDITIPEAKKNGFFSCMALIPQLHPLYLDENLKYLGGSRLYKVSVLLGLREESIREEDLNLIPHPHV